MQEDSLEGLLAWLKADRAPVLVLLPQAEYERLAAEWQLPGI
jgi:hypothetical protein